MGSKKLSKGKSRKAPIYKGIECLNCGCPLQTSDNHCPNCSQLNSTKQLSIFDFFNEFFSSLFTYDSRLRYTLKDLLFKPGVITRNYVAGQRLKYANPFRFYLSISIVFFILKSFSLGNGLDQINLDELSNIGYNISPDTPENITISESHYFNSDSLKNEIDSIIKTDNNVENKKKKDSTHTYLSEVELGTMDWPTQFGKRFLLYQKFYKDTKIKSANKALDSLRHPKTKLNKWFYNKNEAFNRVKESPSKFVKYLMQKTPFFLFFFAPFYALFFWIIYATKKYSYMEHLIFIFHIFSFVFLAGSITYLLDFLLGDNNIFSSILFLIIGPFYFYKARRNFYKQSRIITLLKFTFLNFIFLTGTAIASIIFFSATAAVY